MSKQVKVFNPFYLLLMIVGILFAFTALGYGVMSVKMLDPTKLTEQDSSFVDFFDQYGAMLFLVELAALAVLTLLAIVTDGFWTRLAQRRQQAEEEKSVTEEEPTS